MCNDYNSDINGPHIFCKLKEVLSVLNKLLENTALHTPVTASMQHQGLGIMQESKKDWTTCLYLVTLAHYGDPKEVDRVHVEGDLHVKQHVQVGVYHVCQLTVIIFNDSVESVTLDIELALDRCVG